jgi:hypothetical protein
VIIKFPLPDALMNPKAVAPFAGEARAAVDEQAVGVGQWSGTVPSGGHMLRIKAPGERTYQNEIVVRDKEAREVSATLDPESSGPSTSPGSVPLAFLR